MNTEERIQLTREIDDLNQAKRERDMIMQFGEDIRRFKAKSDGLLDEIEKMLVDRYEKEVESWLAQRDRAIQFQSGVVDEIVYQEDPE